MSTGTSMSGGFQTQRLAVVGLGLMGGSIALALRHFAEYIIGVDQNAETRQYALDHQIVDDATADLKEGVSQADVVILCAPVRVVLEILQKRIGSYLRSNTLLIDIGSTKKDICDAMGQLPIGIHAIGGHPMTGKERSGIAASDPALYQDRPFVLCSTRRTTPATRLRALALVQALNAVPIEMDATRHDRVVAAISHLPYLLSAALVATVAAEAENDPAVWQLAAGGFRDTSRLAGSDITMMGDILSTNTQAVATLLALFRVQMGLLETKLIAHDYEHLLQSLEPLRAARLTWSEQHEKQPERKNAEMTSAPDLALVISSGQPLVGSTSVPGDKSISHRAILFGMLAEGRTEVRGWLAAGDTEASLNAARTLGAQIDRHDTNTLTIHGGTLKAPADPVNLVNAGTGIRLLAGIMAGQSFPSVLDGSEQLRRRPMKRIITPLTAMGARIDAVDGRAPLTITPAPLKGITYEMPMASAQVKSAVLLAGLYADRETTVIQPGPARDHTERMLAAMGVDLTTDGTHVTLLPGETLHPLDITVPGDFSSAAFLLVAASIVPGSDITLTGINLNDTRTGLLDVLLEMGADITIFNESVEGGEPVGDLRVRYRELKGVHIGGDTVVRMIDEFPILMVAALCAQGETVVRDAQELRVKETDRIAVMAAELRKFGAEVIELEDGFRITGTHQLTGAVVDGHDDHRIAMSMSVMAMVAEGETTVLDARCAGDSFPGFAETLQKLGAAVDQQTSTPLTS